MDIENSLKNKMLEIKATLQILKPASEAFDFMSNSE